MLMMEGVNMRRQFEREQQTETLYLLRFIASSISNLISSFSKNPKKVDQTDIWPIPEIDKYIEKQRKIEKEKFNERAEHVLKKYQNLVNNDG